MSTKSKGPVTSRAVAPIADPVNVERLPAEKAPSAEGGSARTSTTGSAITPSAHAARGSSGSSFAVRAVHSRPIAATDMMAAPIGTSHAVRDER